jgi:hypothetical protein
MVAPFTRFISRFTCTVPRERSPRGGLAADRTGEIDDGRRLRGREMLRLALREALDHVHEPRRLRRAHRELDVAELAKARVPKRRDDALIIEHDERRPNRVEVARDFVFLVFDERDRSARLGREHLLLGCAERSDALDVCEVRHVARLSHR